MGMNKEEMKKELKTRSQEVLKVRKGLAGKIMKWISIPVVLIFLCSGFLMLRNVKSTVSDDLSQKELIITTQAASYQINNFFENYMVRVTEASANKLYENLMLDTASGERLEKSPYYEDAMKGIQKAQATDSENILSSWLADFDASELMMSDGFLSDPSLDVSTRPWYQVANTKKPLITEPYEDVSTGKQVVTVVAPLYDEAKNIIGATGVDIEMGQMASIMKSYNLDETVRFMLTDSVGNIIYIPDEELIGKNIKEIGLSDNIISNITNNVSEFTGFAFNGVDCYGYVSAVGSTNWNITSIKTVSEYNRVFNELAALIVIIFVVGIVIILCILKYMASSIVKPLKALTVTANEIAGGNLDVEVNVTTQDEIGLLGEAIASTVRRLKDYIMYINEVGQVLDQIADGDLRFSLHCDYVGEFERLKTGLLNIQKKLTDLLGRINDTAGQVSEGAFQIAQSAAMIADSSTEQAGSVDKLSKSIAEVVDLTSQNQQNAKDANQSAQMASSYMTDGNEQIIELTETIESVNAVSQKINGILETINDIAEQTNLLSLNASIEAARAGEAGRGFGVVAGEIGHLATQTTNSSKETGEMIETILQSIQNGTQMAKKTTGVMDHVLDSAKEASTGISSISLAIEKEKEAIVQLEEEINQIMSVVENNTAASEESVAASEELATQAEALKRLVGEFKI